MKGKATDQPPGKRGPASPATLAVRSPGAFDKLKTHGALVVQAQPREEWQPPRTDLEDIRVERTAWIGKLGETWDRGASIAALVPNMAFLASNLEDSRV